MQLYINSGSPFARKCRIVIRELGLLDQVNEVFVAPAERPDALVAVNPLVQIPALLSDDGTAFIDSPLICAWLNAHYPSATQLIPPMGDEHWRVRRLETLADGLLEMVVKIVLEKRRPEHEQSKGWINRWSDNIALSLSQLNALCPEAEASIDMGSLTIALAMTYLDFRMPELSWKSQYTRLHAIQTGFEKRQSFVDTYPK